MHRRDNCEFQFVQVQDARVQVECEKGTGDTTNENEGGVGGCYATLALDLSVTGQKLIEHELPQDSHEDVVSGRVRAHYHPYYTLELHALNHSKITYKGFDGLGYDLCCDFLNASSAHCEWEDTKNTVAGGDESSSSSLPPSEQEDAATQQQRIPRRQRLHHCAVTNPLTPSGRIVSGSIRKPLHKIVAGDWEVRWTLRRGSETVGRLIVPFHITDEMLSGGTSQQVDTSASSAAAASAPLVDSPTTGTAVVTVEEQREHGSDKVTHAPAKVEEL